MTAARLLQHRSVDGIRGLILAEEGAAHFLTGPSTTAELACEAIAGGERLVTSARRYRTGTKVDLFEELDAGRLLPAIDLPDPARLMLTGTGLTHLGSAEGRDGMHRRDADPDRQTDSMRLFLDGVEGGKPSDGRTGRQPEWFYKGDGRSLVAPGADLESPDFALDGGEEPELAGIYLVGPDGTPWRLGIALANEFSDHLTEQHNYLWLAHSKLRPAALGAELLLGDFPSDVRGRVRVVRGGRPIWERGFLTGETNMSHSLSNLEAHHFKYPAFRRPGDVHVHFLGTATLSHADGIRPASGDVFEIEAAPFELPLRNTMRVGKPANVAVRAL